MTSKIKTDETLPDVPASKVKEAQMDGVQEAIADGAKARFLATDGVEVQDYDPGITVTSNAFHLGDLLEMEPDALADRLAGKGPDANAVTEGQIASLLEMERSGKNRDDIVVVLCDRLGIKSPYEVTDAGPNYTNVVGRKVLTRG